MTLKKTTELFQKSLFLLFYPAGKIGKKEAQENRKDGYEPKASARKEAEKKEVFFLGFLEKKARDNDGNIEPKKQGKI